MHDLHVAEKIRSFNRFFTEAIGSLDEQHEGLDLNLTEARVLYTVDSLEQCNVNEIADHLTLDLAYTSRVLGSLEDSKLLRRTISPEDRRRRVVALTAKGKRLIEEVKRRSNERVLALTNHLSKDEVSELLKAMATIRNLVERSSAEPDLS